ncbi:hypothetical protein ACQB60_33935 [Actinomycetota bacterium Odt1-20B]
MKKIRMGVVSVAALGAAAFAVPAGGAQALPGAPATATASGTVQSTGDVTSAASCSGWKYVAGSGGYLKYKVCKTATKRLVKGVLNDTKSDGRCLRATVRFIPRGPSKQHLDCGGAPTTFTDGWYKALGVRVSLR